MSESNIFAEKDGYNVHFKITGDTDELKKTMSNTEVLIGWMKANGYVHDTSRDRPRGGGGGQRPVVDDTPPPDVIVPEHCGEPMRYKAANQVFECRKGQNCAQARDVNGKKYGASKWLKQVARQPA